MNAEELAAIRERLRRAPDYDGPETDADALLAHIDALTAKVRDMPGFHLVGDAMEGPNAGGPWLTRVAVLAFLGGEA